MLKGKKNPNFIHGMSGKRFYRVWQSMKYRCLNSTNPDFHNYGGRGIKVCDRWLDFNNFYNDMYDSYLEHADKHSERNTTIDRKDNNGNYYKENCKWETRQKQGYNRRTNRLITYNNETKTLSEWAKTFNLKRSTLEMRLGKYGWSLEKALNTPVT